MLSSKRAPASTAVAAETHSLDQASKAFGTLPHGGRTRRGDTVDVPPRRKAKATKIPCRPIDG